MKNDKEHRFAKTTGYHRLGKLETSVKITLTQDDKLKLGAEMSESLHEIQSIENKKKEIDDQLKADMKKAENEVFERATLIKNGYRIEHMTLPCFIDPKAGERVYVNLETGEEMHREPMHEQDRQLSMDIENAA